MRLGSLIILLLLASAAVSQDIGTAAARERIASCIVEADDDVMGLEALESVCPGLDHALAESGYAGFISEEESDSLTRLGLLDLQTIVDRYRSAPGGSAGRADPAKLGPILSQLEQEQVSDQPLSLLDRFKRWLNGLMGRAEQERESWFSRWLRDVDVPEKVTRSIVYVAIGLILLIALVVVVNELRAAGILRRRGKRSGAAAESHVAAASAAHATLADLERVPLGDRPSLLLRVLVDSLVSTGRLRTERSLTHGELVRRAAFDATDQRTSFNRVAALSERILYGNANVAADEIDAVVQAGRALNEQLHAPRAAT